MYYRDGARISHTEGERYNAKKRESHASCRRKGSPSIISPSTGKCIKKGAIAYKALQKRGLISSPRRKTPVKVDQTVKCTDNEQYNTHTGKCNKIGGRAWKNAVEKGWVKASSSRRKTPEKPSRKSPCAKNEQYNTHTGKCNKIGGRAWKNAVEKGWIKASSSRRKTPSKSPRKTPAKVVCNKGQQYNTYTGKCNKIGGRAWKNAVEKGWITETLPSVSRGSSSGSLIGNVPLPKKKKTPTVDGDKCEGVVCEDDKVCNPTSGICVKIGGRVHRTLMKNGMVPLIDLPSPKSKKRPLVRNPVIRPKEGPRWKPTRLSPKTQCVKRSKLPLTAAQLKVVQYMDTHDGLIVVHGTGCGKTLTAVTCTQCYLDQNPGHGVIFVGPASLTANFKKEMKAYGVTDISQYKFYSFDKFMRDYEAGRIDATDKFLVVY